MKKNKSAITEILLVLIIGFSIGMFVAYKNNKKGISLYSTSLLKQYKSNDSTLIEFNKK